MQDHGIEWIRKRKWITPFDMQGVTVGTALFAAYETAGVTDLEVTNVGMGTLVMTDGEFLNGYIRCPYDLDPGFPVGFRVAWTLDHDGVGAGDASWILLQNAIAHGAAIALPDAVLDTAIVVPSTYVDTSGDATVVTDFLLQWSARGIRNLIGLTRNQIEAGAFLTFKLELDAATNETTVRYIGMEMDYVPQRTVGMGSHINRPLKSNGVS
jgi:hypothetical protein